MTPNDEERQAAWELYVELVTRVALARVDPELGSLRTALTSLHSLFDTTRHILRTHGPEIAVPDDDSDLSFGYIAVSILNGVLRPVLEKWHPRLEAHEHNRQPDMSAIEHENAWSESVELRAALHDEVRVMLLDYAKVLQEIAGVQSLVPE